MYITLYNLIIIGIMARTSRYSSHYLALRFPFHVLTWKVKWKALHCGIGHPCDEPTKLICRGRSFARVHQEISRQRSTARGELHQPLINKDHDRSVKSDTKKITQTENALLSIILNVHFKLSCLEHVFVFTMVVTRLMTNRYE